MGLFSHLGTVQAIVLPTALGVEPADSVLTEKCGAYDPLGSGASRPEHSTAPNRPFSQDFCGGPHIRPYLPPHSSKPRKGGVSKETEAQSGGGSSPWLCHRRGCRVCGEAPCGVADCPRRGLYQAWHHLKPEHPRARSGWGAAFEGEPQEAGGRGRAGAQESQDVSPFSWLLAPPGYGVLSPLTLPSRA